jgi:Zn-dependent protease with chaperone function
VNPLLQLFVAITLSAFLAGSEEPSAPGIVAVLLAYFALGRGFAGALARRVLSAEDPHGADVFLQSYRRAVSFHRFLALPAHAWILVSGGWATVAESVGPSGEFVHMAVGVAPWLVLQLLAVIATWPAEKALNGGDSLRSNLVLRARMLLLVAMPFLVLMAVRGALLWMDESGIEPVRTVADLSARYEFLSLALLLGSLALVLAVTPVIGMKAIGARPMEDGPLRRRLETYARRVGLRYRNLYVWNTNGSMLNAAVLGVGARLRCVVFTDALLERMEPDEVEAVFAHEAGHALHHHLPLFFLFTTGYLLAFVSASALLPTETMRALENDPLVMAVLALVGILVYFGLLFGFVSRRLEQQADVHGLLTTGLDEGQSPREVLRDPSKHPSIRAVEAAEAEPADHPFVRSLETIALSMGGLREITGWRHFSVGDRVRFLDAYQSSEGVRATYRTRLRGLLAILLVVFLAFAAGAAADVPRQLEGPDPTAAFDRALLAVRSGRPDIARTWISWGVRGGEIRGRTFYPPGGGLAPGRPALRLTALGLAQVNGDRRLADRPWTRVRMAGFHAIVQSLDGKDERALALAMDAAEEASFVHPLLHAESLLLVADLLDRAGRTGAARDARSRAAERADLAGRDGRRLALRARALLAREG